MRCAAERARAQTESGHEFRAVIAAPIARRGLFSSLFFVAVVRNPVVFLRKLELEVKYMNVTLNEQIAPEIVQAITREAAARGLSVNDYLRDLLGLTNGPDQELALAEEAQPRNEEMLAIIRRSRERLKDMPVRGSTEEALKMIRRARAGEMWGYEPTDTE